MDSFVDLVLLRITARDGQGCGRIIEGGNAGQGQGMRDGYGDRSGARANVGNTQRTNLATFLSPNLDFLTGLCKSEVTADGACVSMSLSHSSINGSYALPFMQSIPRKT